MKIKFALIAAASVFAVASTPAVAQNFSGPFVGVEFGLDSFEAKTPEVNGISGNGVVGGVFAGYDVSFGNLFAGVEGEVSLSDARISYDDGFDALQARAKESFGASARLGAKINDSTGLYARAGWVNTKLKARENGALLFSDSNDGLVLGAGVETGLANNTSLRVEYNYADYNDFLKNNSVRAGVAVRF